MLPYMNTLPKNVPERQMQAKFDTDFTRGIELRLLNDEEFIQRIEVRLKKGHKFTFLMDKPEDVSVRDWIAEVEKISYK